MSMRPLAVAATLLAFSSLTTSCTSRVQSATSNPTPSRTSVPTSTPPSASAPTPTPALCESGHERIRLMAQGSNTTVVIAPIVTDSTGRMCEASGHGLRLSLVDPQGHPLRVDGAPAIVQLGVSQGANLFDWSNWCGPHVVVTIVGQLDGGPKIGLTSPYLPACLAATSPSTLSVIAN
jgi:hypothetical protein